MKRVSLAGVLILVFGLFFANFALAANYVSMDLEKLSPEEAVRVLALQKKAAESTSISTAAQAESWAIVGEKWGKAIAAVAKELSITANEFIKTPVGKFTMVVIAWKVFGKDLWHIVGGSIAWLVISLIILWSFKFFHMKKKVCNKETKQTAYIARYDFKTNDARTASAVCHVLAFLAITITCLAVVF